MPRSASPGRAAECDCVAWPERGNDTPRKKQRGHALLIRMSFRTTPIKDTDSNKMSPSYATAADAVSGGFYFAVVSRRGFRSTIATDQQNIIASYCLIIAACLRGSPKECLGALGEQMASSIRNGTRWTSVGVEQ